MSGDSAQGMRHRSLAEVASIARSDTEDLDACIQRLEAKIDEAKTRRAQAQAALAFCVTALEATEVVAETGPPVRPAVGRRLRTNPNRVNRNSTGLNREESARRFMAMRGTQVTARDCAEYFAGGGPVTRNNVETMRKALTRMVTQGLVTKPSESTYVLAPSIGAETPQGIEGEVKIAFSRAA